MKYSELLVKIQLYEGIKCSVSALMVVSFIAVGALQFVGAINRSTSNSHYADKFWTRIQFQSLLYLGVVGLLFTMTSSVLPSGEILKAQYNEEHPEAKVK